MKKNNLNLISIACKSLMSVLTFVSLSSLAACSSNTSTRIAPQGAISIVNRDIPTAFQNIVVKSGIEVIVSSGETSSVRVETFANVHSFVEISQSAATLNIRVRPGTSFKSDPRIRVFITLPTLHAVDLAEGARMTIANKFNVDALTLDLSGGSSFTGDITASLSVSAELSGGSRLSLVGTSDRYQITCSGGSQAYDFDFVCQSVVTDLSGGSHANVTAVKDIVLSASGGSILRYKGEPTIKGITISGGSSLENVK